MRQRIGYCKAPDGASIAFATSGNGPPLVRVGTWLTHLELDWGSPVWRHWLEAFSRDHTLVRFDLRGSGLSDRHVDDFSLDAMVSDLEAVVDALALERFPLLGVCLGGAVAIAYAARHPERVSRLILFDSYLAGGLTRDDGDSELQRAQALAEMIRIGWGRNTPAYRELFSNLLMPDAPPESARWFTDLQRQTASAETAYRLWNAFHRVDVSRDAEAVSAPTLVFHVTRNGMVPLEEGKRVASSIKHARFVPLSGRNHILQPSDTAWPQFLDEARRFLAEESHVAPSLAALTGRERAVLELMAQGLSNDEIAGELFVAPKSVRNYVSRIFSKLAVERRAQAIVLAREAGLGTQTHPYHPAPA